ncbi:hypothetical protein DFQ59_103260 [Thioalbus denitrificans]|uniref:Uncharacterized protein n=1 Tax=Thioalbus denitrificans TaxID=547122 RepID=A0A369CB83_9GAMM|nr:hypothetical protein DFQ59_103260 [Thioalbus denitrificans]
MWLLNKLFTHADQPTPRFAFQGTVNWMRGLAILVDGQFSYQQLQQFYQRTQRRQANEQADALAYECLTMSIHNVSAIDSMKVIENPYPIVRSAIVAWYYATYYAAKAMLAASSGTDPQTHASAGKVWQAEIVGAGLVMAPFDLCITGITPNNVRQVMSTLRAGNAHYLNTEPTNEDMARGALYSYLKGTAEYEQWRIEEMVKDSREYKQGGFNSFRSDAAKALRDVKLNPAHVNYLVQAFRYRGKANYRDAIYLSYGRDDTERLRQFVSDLAAVAGAFSLMAAHYAAKRVVRNDWAEFVTDLEEYAKFELPFDLGEI